MKRISARQRQAATFNARVIQIIDDLVFRFLREQHTRIQALRRLVVTASTLMHTARHKQCAARTRSVNNVNWIILVVVHNASLCYREKENQPKAG